MNFYEHWIVFLLGATSVILVIIVLILIRQRSFYSSKLIEINLQALRSQLNPHFISNSLNAIESLVNQGRNEEASEYLIDFSRLIRHVLDQSKKSLITLGEEIDALKYYLALEQLRFPDDFNFVIQIDNRLNQKTCLVPPLLLQPIVENAISHGIMNMQDPKNGELTIHVKWLSKDKMEYCVEDNGVGRGFANEIKRTNPINDRSSWGIGLISQRIKFINKSGYKNMATIDLRNAESKAIGTRVILQIPIIS